MVTHETRFVLYFLQDALKFPVVGSVLLLSLFLAYKFLPADILNLVVSIYFVGIGTLGMVATVDPIMAPLLPRRLSSEEKEICFPKIPLLLPEGLEIGFTPLEALLCIPAAFFCKWYWQSKHWLANNGLGIAFSLQGIEHLSLGTVQNGVILLTLLFFYDIFWVFFTPVMVTVAKKFDAPIKLLFPRIPPPAADVPQYSMLGLGDIVIPGIFVAIVLRYDMKNGGKKNIFWSAFAGYVIGLVATILVMTIFQAAQPALLYLVPSVLATTFGHAFLIGKSSSLYNFTEAEEMDKTHSDKDTNDATKEPKTPEKQQTSLNEESTRRVTRSASKASKKDS